MSKSSQPKRPNYEDIKPRTVLFCLRCGVERKTDDPICNNCKGVEWIFIDERGNASLLPSSQSLSSLSSLHVKGNINADVIHHDVDQSMQEILNLTGKKGNVCK